MCCARDLSQSSPWRLGDSAAAIAHNLRLAHEDMASVFDTDGHVQPVGLVMDLAPREPLELAPQRFFHRRQQAG